MDVRERVLRKEKERGLEILSKLERALGREFTSDEILEILLHRYGSVEGQAVDHMAAHLGLENILSQGELDQIYAYEADVEQKDR